MRGSPPLVSVVAATHNRADRLQELLASLERQTAAREAFEVVIVDDASSNGDTTELLARHAAAGRLNLRVIRRARSAGPAAARNDGWRAARAPLVAFTDDDCVVDAGWVAAWTSAAEHHPGAVLQGPTEPRPDELHRRGPFSRTLRVDRLGPFFQTCNVLYPRQLLERLGGFDAEAFSRPGGEDTDLAWRAMAHGVATAWVPAALVQHAVTRHGPVGLLRVAWRWTDSMQVYPRYPELRRLVFTKHLFWKAEHYLLARALVALVLPRRLRLLRRWLAWPYAASLVWRSLQPDSRGPALIPYLVLHDGVEMVAVARAAARYRIAVL